MSRSSMSRQRPSPSPSPAEPAARSRAQRDGLNRAQRLIWEQPNSSRQRTFRAVMSRLAVLGLGLGLLSWLASACRTGSPTPTLAPPAQEISAPAPAPACLADSWRPALEVPAHASPSFAIDTGLWAEVVRPGPLHPTAEGSPVPTQDLELFAEEFTPYTATVLDAGEGPEDRRRILLLCDEGHHRMGLWHAANDLRRTNRSRTLLVGAPAIPKVVDETTPGVDLPAGAVEAEDPGDATTATLARASFDGIHFRAEGWISAAVVDIVAQTETTPPESYFVDGVLVGSEVTVHDSPGGTAFASFHASDWPRLVRRLDERSGFVLVRFGAHDATLVGWVEASAFEAHPPEILTRGKAGRGGRGMSGRHMTTLEPGTLLVHEASEVVVGVVVQAAQYVCADACEEPAPRVVIIACDHRIDLRALRPSTSARLCQAD
jgi:hypothetical protein